MNIDDIRKVAVPVCREFNVSRLDAFGSAARGSSTSSNDVDLLVEFRESARSSAKRFFGLLHTLEDSLGCEVDLLTPNSLRNPYFKARVMQEKISVYAEEPTR